MFFLSVKLLGDSEVQSCLRTTVLAIYYSVYFRCTNMRSLLESQAVRNIEDFLSKHLSFLANHCPAYL